MPLATELEATIDTLALQNIQGLLDEGSDQTPTAGPAQATLISAAAEFRIANYDAADIDQFVIFSKLKIAGVDPKSPRGSLVCSHHRVRDLPLSHL